MLYVGEKRATVIVSLEEHKAEHEVQTEVPSTIETVYHCKKTHKMFIINTQSISNVAVNVESPPEPELIETTPVVCDFEITNVTECEREETETEKEDCSSLDAIAMEDLSGLGVDAEMNDTSGRDEVDSNDLGVDLHENNESENIDTNNHEDEAESGICIFKEYRLLFSCDGSHTVTYTYNVPLEDVEVDSVQSDTLETEVNEISGYFPSEEVERISENVPLEEVKDKPDNGCLSEEKDTSDNVTIDDVNVDPEKSYTLEKDDNVISNTFTVNELMQERIIIEPKDLQYITMVQKESRQSNDLVFTHNDVENLLNDQSIGIGFTIVDEPIENVEIMENQPMNDGDIINDDNIIENSNGTTNSESPNKLKKISKKGFKSRKQKANQQTITKSKKPKVVKKNITKVKLIKRMNEWENITSTRFMRPKPENVSVIIPKRQEKSENKSTKRKNEFESGTESKKQKSDVTNTKKESKTSTNLTQVKSNLSSRPIVYAKKSNAAEQLIPVKEDVIPEKMRKSKTPILVGDLIITIKFDPPLYQCTICQKKFKTKAHKKYHEYCRSDGKDKPFGCTICSQRFVAKSHFQYHLRTHTGERPFPCPTCGKGFNQRSKVNRHMLSHTGVKKFKCDKCDKAFTNSQGLRSHTLVHTGERPYACTICQKKFTAMTNLKKHNLTHTNERPFCCDICDKSFQLKWSLTVHKNIHYGNKPYVCEQKGCGKRFAYHKDLRRHMATSTHLNIRPYLCKVCSAKFRRKDNLTRHIEITHKISKKIAKDMADEVASNVDFKKLMRLSLEKADSLSNEISKNEISKKEIPKKEISKKEISEKEISKKEISKKENSKKEISKKENSKKEISKKRISKKKISKKEISKKKIPKQRKSKRRTA